MRKTYSQREARRLARRVHQLEQFLNGYGVEIARCTVSTTAEKVRVATQLNHPVIVTAFENGQLVFRGLGQIPTVE